MRLREFTLIILTVLGLEVVRGQNSEVTIFDQNVKSLKVNTIGSIYSLPIIQLGSQDRININFDYLDADQQYLQYNVLHCDRYWKPSRLNESEFVDGFNYGDITDVKISRSTFAQYQNYNFTVPNADFQLTKSGNYILRIYRQGDPDDVLCQVRFMVYEPMMTFGAEVSSRTDVDYNDAHQQLGLTVNYPAGTVADAATDLHLTVYRDADMNHPSYVNTPPLRTTPQSAIYEHSKDLIFTAGNEFRRFETVSVHTLNMGVERIEYVTPYYHATLRTDEPRANEPYLYDQGQFGHFTIRNSDAMYSDTEADYVACHFALRTAGPLDGGVVRLDGELVQGLPNDQKELRWNGELQCYTLDLLLKQGAYNYQYLWVPDGSDVGRTAEIEGDKYQTRNRYTVVCYFSPPGARYDRLTGMATVVSGQ